MDTKEIGKRLRIARNNCNLTQKEVCDKANIPKVQSLSSYENGTTKIPVDTLSELCSLYRVTTDSIIYGEQSILPANNTPEDNIRLLVALVDSLNLPIREAETKTDDKYSSSHLFGSNFSIGLDSVLYRGLGDFMNKWKRLRDLFDAGVIDGEEYSTLLENKLLSLNIEKVDIQMFDTPFGKLPFDPTKYLD